VVIPSAARPKLLVPARPLRVAAGAVRNFKTAASPREQAKINLLAFALRSGAHLALRDRIDVTRDVAGIDRHLSEVLGRRVHVSLYISPPRAVRKPVLQVLDERGETFAFAKLGVDEFTRALVRAEGEAVARVSAAGLRVLRAPEVLHHAGWNGHELLVQSALPRGSTLEPGSTLLREAVVELAAIDGTTRSRLAESGYLRRLGERIAGLPPGEHAEVLAEAIETVRRECGSVELAFGASHGDWAPWNMTALGDTAFVWDWEKFEQDVPLGIDAVHYAVQGAVVIGGATPLDAFADTFSRAAEVVPGVDADAAQLVVWLYAVDIASRYLVDREAEAGLTRMSDLRTWLRSVNTLAAARFARPASA
jgi:hypothetical protein